MTDPTALVPLEVDRSQLNVNPDDTQLTPGQKQLVAQIVKEFNPERDQMAITQYGIVTTNGIAALADPVLKLVRGKDQPQAAAILDNCAKDAGKIDFTQVKKAETELATMPAARLPDGIKRLLGAIDRLKRQVETLDRKMNQAKARLIADKLQLTTRANTLFGLYKQSLDIYSQMRAYVYAADAKLAQLNAKKNMAVAAVETAPDKALAQQEVTRLTATITRLEARKMALQQMGTIAVQQVYAIQAVMVNAVGLLDTVEVNMAAVETVWKTQVVIALSAYQQLIIAKQQQAFAQNLGALMNATADQIGMAIQATADAQSTGIVTVDALQAANDKMVQNIKDYFDAQKRVEAAAKDTSSKVAQMRSDLVAAVKDATGDTKGVS